MSSRTMGMVRLRSSSINLYFPLNLGPFSDHMKNEGIRGAEYQSQCLAFQHAVAQKNMECSPFVCSSIGARNANTQKGHCLARGRRGEKVRERGETDRKREKREEGNILPGCLLDTSIATFFSIRDP